MDKEAWDKLKYEHDVDGDHVELSGPPVFDPIKGTLEFKVDKEDIVSAMLELKKEGMIQ